LHGIRLRLQWPAVCACVHNSSTYMCLNACNDLMVDGNGVAAKLLLSSVRYCRLVKLPMLRSIEPLRLFAARFLEHVEQFHQGKLQRMRPMVAQVLRLQYQVRQALGGTTYTCTTVELSVVHPTPNHMFWHGSPSSQFVSRVQ
jgi:hypothetical protein